MDKLQLPIPATYVIDSNQVIQFAFASEDFTERADIEEIIKVLKRIKPKH
jgi:peroxiredoxin